VNTTIGSTISGTALAESGGARPARRDSSNMAFFWMSAFYLVYCIRPEDWLPALAIIPLAKITAIGASLAFLFGGKRRRGLRDLPAESYYLLGMIVILMLSAVFSPVWRGGAVSHTLDFAKVYVVFVLTFLLLTDLAKFRRILFIQAASVPAICILSLVKGHDRPRLEGVLGGIYNNPNDLAFAIVLSIPFLPDVSTQGTRLLPQAAMDGRRAGHGCRPLQNGFKRRFYYPDSCRVGPAVAFRYKR